MDKNGRGRNRLKQKKRLKASLTVEAAYIISLVLLCMAVLIRFGFQIHDQAVGNAVLNEGIELAGHAAEPDTGNLSVRGSRRMEHALSGQGFQITISEYRDGFRGSAGGNRYRREMTDKGFRPEKFLRRITLIEGLGD